MIEDFVNKNFNDIDRKIIKKSIKDEKLILDRIQNKNSFFILSLLDLKYIELWNLNIFLKNTKFFNYKDEDGNKIDELELLKLYLLKYRCIKYCYSSPELFKLQKIFMSESYNLKKNNLKNKRSFKYDSIFKNNNFNTDPINIEFKIFIIYPILNMFNKKIIINSQYYDYSLNNNIEVYNQIFLDITETITLYTFIDHCINMLSFIQKFKSINYIYYIQSYICSIKKLLSRNILFNKFNFSDDNNIDKLKFINNLLNKLKNFSDIIYPMIFNILLINKKEIKNLKDNIFGITLRNGKITKDSENHENDYSQIYTWNIKTIKYDILKIMIFVFQNFKFFYYEIWDNINKKKNSDKQIFNILENLKDIFNETFSSLLTKNLLQETIFVNSKIIKLINEINLLIFDNDNKKNSNNIIIENNDKELLNKTYYNEYSFFNLLTNFNNSLYKIIKEYKKLNNENNTGQNIYGCHYYHCLNTKKDNMMKCIEYYFLEILKYDIKNNKDILISKFNEDVSEDNNINNNKKSFDLDKLKYSNYKVYLNTLYKNKIKNIISEDWSKYKFEVSNLEIKSILKYIYYICFINPIELGFNIEANIWLYLLLDILIISKNISFCFDILYSYEIKSIIEYYPENILLIFKQIIKIITLKRKNDTFVDIKHKTNLLMNNIEIIFNLLQLIFNKKFYNFKNKEVHIANNYDQNQSEIWEDYVEDIFEGYEDKEFKKNLCNNIKKTKDFKFLTLFINIIKKIKNRVKNFHFNYLEKINYYIFSLLFKKETIWITNNWIQLFNGDELNIYITNILKLKIKKRKKSMIIFLNILLKIV